MLTNSIRYIKPRTVTLIIRVTVTGDGADDDDTLSLNIRMDLCSPEELGGGHMYIRLLTQKQSGFPSRSGRAPPIRSDRRGQEEL